MELKNTIVFDNIRKGINKKCLFIENGQVFKIRFDGADAVKYDHIDTDLKPDGVLFYGSEKIEYVNVKKTKPKYKGYYQKRYKYHLNTGSSRSSKTWSICQIIFLYCLKNKNKRVLVLRDVAKDCRDKVESEFKKWAKDSGAFEDYIENKSKHSYTFANGSVITFDGADNENRTIGQTQDVVWINEPYNFQENIFKQLDMRTSDFIIIDWNPQNGHWLQENIEPNTRTFNLHSTFDKNQYCPLESKLEIMSYKPTPQNIKKGTADAYMWSVYGLGLYAENPDKIYHNWEKISDSKFESIKAESYIGMDFGQLNATAIIECKCVEYEGVWNVFLKERFYAPKEDTPELSYSQICENIGIDKDIEFVTDIDIDAQNNLVDAGYYVRTADKKSGSVLAGIRLMKRCKVHFTEESENLYDNYMHYQWEKIGGQQIPKPKKAKDHALDASRYIVDYIINSVNR